MSLCRGARGHGGRRENDPPFAGNLVGNLGAVAAWPATGEIDQFANRVNQGERLVLASVNLGGVFAAPSYAKILSVLYEDVVPAHEWRKKGKLC